MNAFIRKAHRWLSMIFMATVIFNLVALFTGRQATWIGLTALLPLVLLMISGTYMFFLPYVRGAAKKG